MKRCKERELRPTAPEKEGRTKPLKEKAKDEDLIVKRDRLKIGNGLDQML
jgi:hypothetical protein